MRARSAITERSPRITSLPGKASRAISAQRSGPMPAGSPAVSATSGALALVVAVLDEGPVARLAQPVLVGLVGLARANRLLRRDSLAVVGELLRAALDHLHEVPSEGRLHRLAHLARAQRVHGALELRHRVAGRHPPQGAALGGARILGVLVRDVAGTGSAGGSRAAARGPGCATAGTRNASWRRAPRAGARCRPRRR